MTQVAEQVRERPILFSSPMIRALLDGRKTQTRQIVKRDKAPDCNVLMKHPENVSGGTEYFMDLANPMGPILRCQCPCGRPGDHLWVREAFAPCPGGAEGPMNPTLYRADEKDGYDKLDWKPSIHMPRWASRITLQIDAVRVERLNDISEMDAAREGIYEVRQCITDGFPGYGVSGTTPEDAHDSRRAAFSTLWKSTHGAGSWASNCWVWVLTFHRVAKEPSHA